MTRTNVTRGFLAVLALAVPLSGVAAGPAWKEEVVMFDGAKVVVEREVIHGHLLDQEFSDIRHGPPVKGNRLRVPLAEGGWSVSWEAMGLNPQAIGRVGGTWYLAATPMLCGDYDNWGRPVPPYVFFRYVGKEWQRIGLEEFPAEIGRRNLTYAGSYDHQQAAATGFISADKAKLLNTRLPDYINNIYRSGTVYEWDDCRRRLEVLDRNRRR